VGGDRLLDHHVQPGLQGLDAERGVQEVRGGDDDRVDLPRADHLAGVGVGLEARLALERLEARREGIAHRRQRAARDLVLQQVPGVEPADVAQTDDPEADVFHR